MKKAVVRLSLCDKGSRVSRDPPDEEAHNRKLTTAYCFHRPGYTTNRRIGSEPSLFDTSP